jgi:hypothetical protein
MGLLFAASLVWPGLLTKPKKKPLDAVEETQPILVGHWLVVESVLRFQGGVVQAVPSGSL